MCGQVGIIFGKKRRRIAEREFLNELFIRMLLCSEERGPHASGMANSGVIINFIHQIVKSRFLNQPVCPDWALEKSVIAIGF
jgi:hypothetical protein